MARRLGAALAVLLAGLGAASAARHHEAYATAVAATAPRRGRRRLLAAALLLGGPGGLVGGLASEAELEKRFKGYDKDGSGRISLGEWESAIDHVETSFEDSEVELHPDINLHKIFWKADIDADEHLNLRELLFAEQLILDAAGRGMPAECADQQLFFCRSMEETFDRLARRREVSLSDVNLALARLAGSEDGKLPDKSFANVVKKAFKIADVVRDRSLTKVEMEFLRLLLRNTLVDWNIHDEEEARKAKAKQVALESAKFFRHYDVNKDKRLELYELFERLGSDMIRSKAQQAILETWLPKAFARADADADGIVDPVEAYDLYVTLTRVRWPQ